MTNLKISSEYSAQRMSQKPNPQLQTSIAYLNEYLGFQLEYDKIADVGCGKLRHYKTLSNITKKLYLIDTK